MRIATIDDHPVLRRGLTHLFSEQGWDVVLELGSAAEALQLLPVTDWDVCVLDHFLPDQDGLHVLRELRNLGDTRGVLMHSTLGAEALAARVYALRGNGFLNKGADPAELLRAVRMVGQGQTYVCPTYSQLLVERSFNTPDGNVKTLKHERLSDREYQVACHLARGKSLKEISMELQLTVPTVSTYRSRIMDKLGLTNNVELAHYAREHRLID